MSEIHWGIVISEFTCDALRNLVPFGQFKKRKKRPWRSVTFTKSNTPPWVFFTCFELYKWYQIAQLITFVVRVLL